MISYIASAFNVSPITAWIGILVICITGIWSYIASCQSFWMRNGIITGKSNLMQRFMGNIHIVEHEMVQKHGKLFGTYEFTKPVLFCTDPELLRDIMSKDFHIFPNRRRFNSGSDPILENMVSVMEGDNWKRVRSIMSPTFSTGKLRRMKPLIDECLKTLLDNFEKLTKEGKTEYDMKRVFGAFSMDIVIQVAFGTKVDSLIDENNPIINNARKIVNQDFNPRVMLNILLPKVAQFFKIRVFDDSITDFFKDLTLRIIDERKRQKDNVKRYDFLQLMLDAVENNNADDAKDLKEDDENEYHTIATHNKSLSNEEFVSQAFLFFLAGYDTTATTLSFCAYCLAMNPNVQEKLYKEAKSAFKMNNNIDYDNVHTLKYLDAVISESLRMYPPALFIERRAEQEYTLGNTGVKIPKDCIIHVPTYALHRDADNFPDPDTFKPERFLQENRTHHTYSYMPFGAGPRNCVGMRLALMESKLALLYSVYNYKFSTTSKTKIPPECYKGQQLFAAKDITLRFEKRINN